MVNESDQKFNPHPAAPQMKYGGNRLNRNEMRKKKQDFFGGVRIKGNFRRLLWFEPNHSHEALVNENRWEQKIHLCTNELEKIAFII